MQSQKIRYGRVSASQRKKVYAKISNQIEQAIGINMYVQYGNAFYFNRELSKEEREVATQIIKKAVLDINGVEKALSIDENVNLSPSKLNNRLKNMIHPQKSPNVYVLLKENWLWKRGYGSSHGSHYDYDSHVPLIISKNNLVVKKNSNIVNTVDIPVTIAKILSFNYPGNVDGIPIEVDFHYK